MNNIPGSLTDNHFLFTKAKPQYLSDTSVYFNHVTDYRGIQDGGANSETVERKNLLVKIRVVRKKLCLNTILKYLMHQGPVAEGETERWCEQTWEKMDVEMHLKLKSSFLPFWFVRENEFALLLPFCSVQFLSELGDVSLHWKGGFLLILLIQMLMSSRNISQTHP